MITTVDSGCFHSAENDEQIPHHAMVLHRPVERQKKTERCGTFTGGMSHAERKSEKARVEDNWRNVSRCGFNVEVTW